MLIEVVLIRKYNQPMAMIDGEVMPKPVDLLMESQVIEHRKLAKVLSHAHAVCRANPNLSFYSLEWFPECENV